MRYAKLLFAFGLIVLFAQFGQSQCCCSGAEVTITNGGGFALPAEQVSITKIPNSHGSVRMRTIAESPAEAKFQFYVGCGDGKETLEIEYMGVEMRVRFKLYGEFGRPQVEIPFGLGDYVAEFAKEREDEGARKVIVRHATAEEMKEIEPPAEADATIDQTAYTLGPYLESSWNTRVPRSTRSVWYSSTPLFSPYRNG